MKVINLFFALALCFSMIACSRIQSSVFLKVASRDYNGFIVARDYQGAIYKKIYEAVVGLPDDLTIGYLLNSMEELSTYQGNPVNAPQNPTE